MGGPSRAGRGDRGVFRLGRARRVGLGCLVPLLCVGAFAMVLVFLSAVASGPIQPLELLGVIPPLLLFLAFGLLLLVTTIDETPRAVRNDPVVVVDPTGIELTGIGLLRWTEIDRLCVERHAGSDADSDAEGSALVEYRRLSIWPRNPSVTRRRFLGGMATRLQRVFGRAPLGVFDYELERPLDELIERVRRYAPVEDCP